MHPLGTALLRRRIHLRVHRIRLRVHREYGCDGVNCMGEGGGGLGGRGKKERKKNESGIPIDRGG